MRKNYTYNCQCPICGHENKYLMLEETEGWMECDACQTIVQTDLCRKTVNLPVYDMDQIVILHRKACI